MSILLEIAPIYVCDGCGCELRAGSSRFRAKDHHGIARLTEGSVPEGWRVMTGALLCAGCTDEACRKARAGWVARVEEQ